MLSMQGSLAITITICLLSFFARVLLGIVIYCGVRVRREAVDNHVYFPSYPASACAERGQGLFNGNIFNTEFLLGWSTYNYLKQVWTETAEVTFP